MSKYEDALNYFLDREDGENVTVTCDWLDYAEELKELVNKETQNNLYVFKETQNNLYVFEDTIFNSQQVNAMGLDVDWSYIYIEPDIYPLGRNRKLIVNQEENQAEIAENTNGFLLSVGVTVEESMIKALVDIALNMGENTD